MINTINIPLTTAEQCRKYGTTTEQCTCGDFTHRSGNYTIYGFKMCKHILYKVIEEKRNLYASRLGINVQELLSDTFTSGDMRKALGSPEKAELPLFLSLVKTKK